ncbi:MAG: IS5 family transposase [Candidatus Binataceae bacterium]
MRYALSDAEWRLIEPILACKPRGVPRVDDRRVLNGIFWVLRSGAPWRDLPQCYEPYTTCFSRFVRWRRAGLWDHILDGVAHARNADVQMIDSTIVRGVHQHGASTGRNTDECMGRSRGGLTTKIHAIVDANGLPLRFGLTPGQQHDSLSAPDLLSATLNDGMLLADKAYDSDALRKLPRSCGAWANIPPRRNRKGPICFSPYLYRERNQVKRFFNRIKNCRRIATRYEKHAPHFLAFVKLAAIRLWLRVYEATA